ncbi:MAG: hypothetical protein AAF602_15570, partial [Myxococcota bacterium]
MLSLLALACSNTPVPVQTPIPVPAPVPAPTSDVEVVTLQTSDGVALQADYYGTDPAPAFVLLHMIPPSNDRTNWPRSFVDALQAEGWAALVVDRRGAGGSEGTARDAYEGPNGRLDADAAVAFLTERGHGPIALIGASNGTTSILDYATWAGENDRPAPVALGFMTGGGYTENQTAMSELSGIPSVFTYSTAEATWSEQQRGLDDGNWSFLEYPGGAHGTR